MYINKLDCSIYNEDPTDVPAKYKDAELANITRSQTFTKVGQGETPEGIHLSLAYEQGDIVRWITADEPNLTFYAAKDPSIMRVYQEDQAIDIVKSVPTKVDRVSEIILNVRGELEDVFGSERVVAVVIQQPYMREVYIPEGRLE